MKYTANNDFLQDYGSGHILHTGNESCHFVNWQDFETGALAILFKIKKKELENSKKFKNLYGLPRGGLCLATKLAYLMKLPVIVDKKQISEETIIVDDCTNTGKTLLPYKGYFTVTFAHKDKSVFVPDVYYVKTEKDINFCWEGSLDIN